MKNKYFNKFEFNNALEYIDKNPTIAKIKFEEYINKYPQDYSAYTYYICSLIVLGFLEEADKKIKELQNNWYTDNNFKYHKKKISHLEKNILYCYIKLLCYQHKYDELFKVFEDNFSIILDLNMKSIVFYCRKQVGLLETASRDENSYLYRQIIEYKEEDFVEHIKKHLADFNRDLEHPNSNIFASDFPIYKVIEEVRRIIPSEKRLFTGFYEDSYVFKYDCCGKDNNKTTDYFRVYCFHDTNNIITMCPSLNCDKLPCIDLNYLNKNNSNSNTKIRKLSQIDKFNQRYKLN